LNVSNDTAETQIRTEGAEETVYSKDREKMEQDQIVDGRIIQGGSKVTGTDLCVNTIKSVPVIFEPLVLNE
jgi:hypothetical protein